MKLLLRPKAYRKASGREEILLKRIQARLIILLKYYLKKKYFFLSIIEIELKCRSFTSSRVIGLP